MKYYLMVARVGQNRDDEDGLLYHETQGHSREISEILELLTCGKL